MDKTVVAEMEREAIRGGSGGKVVEERMYWSGNATTAKKGYKSVSVRWQQGVKKLVTGFPIEPSTCPRKQRQDSPLLKSVQLIRFLGGPRWIAEIR